MQPDSERAASADNPQSGNVPLPLLPTAPLLPTTLPVNGSNFARLILTIRLSLGLGLFLLDAVDSLLADSLASFLMLTF